MNQLSVLESILFVVGKPLGIERLAKTLAISEDDVLDLAKQLAERYKSLNTGLRLLIASKEVQMVTAPENAEVVGKFIKDEFDENLTGAALETLAIIAYRGLVSRAEIDQIRGVNSTYILRSLFIRGLIERTENPKRKSSYLYQTSLEFLKHIGLEKNDELPDYQKFKEIQNQENQNLEPESGK